MPQKYLRQDGVPLLLRYSGRTTLPEDPPEPGDGPSVLCLHDAGLQSSVWKDLFASLGPTSAALAFDLPGHGRSGSLDALPSIPAMTETARWVAAECRAERPLLVGHGMGALVALEWARSSPDTLRGVVLCGVGASLGIDDDTIETMRRVTRGKAPRPFDPARVAREGGPDLVKRAYMEGIQTDPRATLVDLEASREWADAFAPSGGIDTPIRIVCGASESNDARARAESLADSLDSATYVEIEAAAHFLPIERPEALAHEIGLLAEAS